MSKKYQRLINLCSRVNLVLCETGRDGEQIVCDGVRDALIEQLVCFELEFADPHEVARSLLRDGHSGISGMLDLDLVQALIAHLSLRLDSETDDSLCPPITDDVMSALEFKEKQLFHQTYKCKEIAC